MREEKNTNCRWEMSVGEVAKRSGVTVSTLHFYESKGLISSTRNAGNQRRYGRNILRIIAIIKVAQRTGIPLAEIKQKLKELPDNRMASKRDWQRLSKQWQAQLNERIERLTRLRDQLTGCIGCGCLSLKECPLRNPHDELAQEGSGPRILDPSN